MRSLESICFALRQERLDQGLTQQELADKAKVSRVWLVGMESGKAKRAEFGKIIDVTTALGVEFEIVRSKKMTDTENMIMRRLLDD